MNNGTFHFDSLIIDNVFKALGTITFNPKNWEEKWHVQEVTSTVMNRGLPGPRQRRWLRKVGAFREGRARSVGIWSTVGPVLRSTSRQINYDKWKKWPLRWERMKCKEFAAFITIFQVVTILWPTRQSVICSVQLDGVGSKPGLSAEE